MNNLKKSQKSQKRVRKTRGTKPLVIYGGGGHGRSIIDIVRLLGKYEIVGIIDDELPPESEVMGVPVLGNADVLSSLRSKGVRAAINAVGGVGDVDTRIKIFDRLQEEGFECPAIIHPTATVETSARLSFGTQILPHAYVGTLAQTGFGVIINNGAIVSHDCQLGDYASLAPGAILAGEVRIGEAVQVGMGVTINLGLSLGERARVGNGAVVKADVPAETVIPAGTIWPLRG
jgi:sugar O-acyltransferase (sialic acid O-acetyltransferase NeuD family)